MKVLVLNCGSSTVKFQLIETDAELIAKNEDRLLAKGTVEKIGTTEALIRFQRTNEKPFIKVGEVLDHKSAIGECLGLLRSGDAPFISMGCPICFTGDIKSGVTGSMAPLIVSLPIDSGRCSTCRKKRLT